MAGVAVITTSRRHSRAIIVTISAVVVAAAADRGTTVIIAATHSSSGAAPTSVMEASVGATCPLSCWTLQREAARRLRKPSVMRMPEHTSRSP